MSTREHAPLAACSRGAAGDRELAGRTGDATRPAPLELALGISVREPRPWVDERDEVRYVYPHAKTLIVLVCEENKPSMQSRYLPTANHELYDCEERLFRWGHEVISLVRTLGGGSLTTTVGWPQEGSGRRPDKIWPLSHKLVAQAAGLGVIGTSRNFLHREYGAYCLIDTVVSRAKTETLVATLWLPPRKSPANRGLL